MGHASSAVGARGAAAAAVADRRESERGRGLWSESKRCTSTAEVDTRATGCLSMIKRSSLLPELPRKKVAGSVVSPRKRPVPNRSDLLRQKSMSNRP